MEKIKEEVLPFAVPFDDVVEWVAKVSPAGCVYYFNKIWALCEILVFIV